MFSTVEAISNFLLRSRVFIYFFLFILFIAGFLEYSYMKITGSFGLKAFSKEFIGYIAIYYKKEIALFGIFTTIFFMALYFYLQNKIKKRKNCAVTEVELKEIAKIWLENEAYKNLVKEEVKGEFEEVEVKEEYTIITPSFKFAKSYNLFEKIKNKKEFFNKEGIEIIADILKLLENNHPTSSVASKFKKDPNYTDYKKLILPNKTSYDILSEVTLYDHSLNVANKAIELLEENEEGGLYLQRVLIAGLAHDIGKIKNLQNVPKELYKNAPHNVISALILREKYPEISKEIIEAVEQHHGAVKNKSNYTLRVLLEADKLAREEEIAQYLAKYKQDNSDKEDIKQDNIKQSNIIQDNINKEETNNNTDKNKTDNNKQDNNKKDDINNIKQDNLDNEKIEQDNINNKKIKQENIDNKDIQAENDETEEVLDIDYEDIFGDDEDEFSIENTFYDYDDEKKRLISAIGDNVCRVEKDKFGINLDNLVVAKNKRIYVSIILLDEVLEDREEFIKAAKSKKEGYFTTIELKVDNKDYKLKTFAIKQEALGIEAECDEVEVKE